MGWVLLSSKIVADGQKKQSCISDLCCMAPKEKHLKNSSCWFFHPLDPRSIFRHGAVIGWWRQTAFKHIAWRPSELWVSRNLARWCPETWETWETLACQTWSQIAHRFPRRAMASSRAWWPCVFEYFQRNPPEALSELNIVLQVKSMWKVDERSTLFSKSKWRP